MAAAFGNYTFLKELKSYTQCKPEDSACRAKKELSLMENVNLNIAVTGESGVGKSTFVNAFRGIKDGEEGAANTGVTETTTYPMKYTHPTMPNVYIWDLPGIGTQNFKAKNYLRTVKFETYDFFILIGAVRFKENDIMLAKEINKSKKMFYFVRSKIDQDINAESRKKNFNEEQVLTTIRMSCKDNLRSFGNPNVFLISTFELEKYDFQKLIDSIAENLSEHKRTALIQSMPVCSMGMIDRKKKELYKIAYAVSAAAACSAAIAIPGLSVGCEIGVMQEFLKKALESFGLDKESLKKLSERVNKPEDQLRAAMTSCFAGGVDEKVVAKMLSTKAMITAKTIEVVLTTIVGLGSLGAMGISFATTLHLLHSGIEDMTEDAKAVLNVALDYKT